MFFLKNISYGTNNLLVFIQIKNVSLKIHKIYSFRLKISEYFRIFGNFSFLHLCRVSLTKNSDWLFTHRLLIKKSPSKCFLNLSDEHR
jgi:hypothetical protein